MRRQAQPPRSRGCDRYSTKRGGVDPTGSAAQPPREGCVHQGDAMSRPRPSPPPHNRQRPTTPPLPSPPPHHHAPPQGCNSQKKKTRVVGASAARHARGGEGGLDGGQGGMGRRGRVGWVTEQRGGVRGRRDRHAPRAPRVRGSRSAASCTGGRRHARRGRAQAAGEGCARRAPPRRLGGGGCERSRAAVRETDVSPTDTTVPPTPPHSRRMSRPSPCPRRRKAEWGSLAACWWGGGFAAATGAPPGTGHRCRSSPPFCDLASASGPRLGALGL